MEAIMGHKRDFPKVVINVGGVKHEVIMMMTRQLDMIVSDEGNVGSFGKEASDQTGHVR